MKIGNTRTNTSQVEDKRTKNKQLARESHVDPTIHSKVTDKSLKSTHFHKIYKRISCLDIGLS